MQGAGVPGQPLPALPRPACRWARTDLAGPELHRRGRAARDRQTDRQAGRSAGASLLAQSARRPGLPVSGAPEAAAQAEPVRCSPLGPGALCPPPRPPVPAVPTQPGGPAPSAVSSAQALLRSAGELPPLFSIPLRLACFRASLGAFPGPWGARHPLVLGAFPGPWGPATLLYWGPSLALGGPATLLYWEPSLDLGGPPPSCTGGLPWPSGGPPPSCTGDVPPSQVSQHCRPLAPSTFLGGM
ncbi:hypothetical protein Celaphus_00002843 [Cervus elaphus hippelaphus]|uniref:Uncharacterized protein n=1 Tax=Cervus elaphus hippelaphus TaxID=46360 RepID=A0A212CFW3_CEREH|nr:hypothetical protein Celaphus_00002843 [Cervus elaphus hippelaphus]